MKRKNVFIIVIAIVIVIIVAAFRSSRSHDKEITLGFVGAITGPAAVYGEPVSQIMKMAIDDINESGGINGKKVKGVYEDGKCSGKDAVAAFTKLITVDKLSYVIGGVCSGESIAMAPVADEHKVLLFSGISASSGLTDINQFFNRTRVTDTNEARALATYAAKLSVNKVAIISEDTDYAKSLGDKFTSAFSESGGAVERFTFATADTDLSSLVDQVIASKPKAIYIIPQTSTSGKKVLIPMVRRNFRPELLMTGIAMNDTSLLSEFPIMENAVMAEISLDPENAKTKDFLARYKARYGRDLPMAQSTAPTYDAVMMLAEGIKQTDGSPEAVSKWIRSQTNYVGVTGVVHMLSNGDRSGESVVPLRVVGGKLAPIN